MCGGDPERAPCTIVSFYSPAYQPLAERLRASLDEWSQHYAIYEVPHVHRSISPAGVDDLALSKASLIRFAWEQFARPLLYLDCDVVLRREPARLAALRALQRDFAIYNWLADEMTDCLVPVAVAGMAPGRLYRFSHSIDLFGPEQLICSGCAQYWAPSDASRALLERWLQAQAQFARASDDECLDYAFNNARGEPAPAYAWLDKCYARYAWWPYVQPVIDHPQLPQSQPFEPIPEGAAGARIHNERLEVRRSPRAFPRDCLVDIEERRLYRPRQSGANSVEFVDAGTVDAEFVP